MTLFAIHSRILLVLVVGLLASPKGWAGDELSDWKAGQAGKYLDERAKSWFSFSGANRGEGVTATTCISCHTLVPYALARPGLRKLAGTETPTEYEKKLFAQIKRRVENWKDLDTAPFSLLYDFSDRKKKEAWGTEAVLNAFILASGDRYQGKTLPSDLTNQAFKNLWKTQVLAGDQKGSWDWLDFQLEPWESKGARFYGAALAAIAVGMMPLSSKSGADVDTEARVKAAPRLSAQRALRAKPTQPSLGPLGFDETRRRLDERRAEEHRRSPP